MSLAAWSRSTYIFIFLLAIQILSGCSRNRAITPTGQQDATTAKIVVAPNPVPAGGEGMGGTTISWDTGDGSLGQVYIAEDGVESKMLAQAAKGSKTVKWIKTGTTYEFRLYAGKEHKTVLAKAAVTRQRKQGTAV